MHIYHPPPAPLATTLPRRAHHSHLTWPTTRRGALTPHPCSYGEREQSAARTLSSGTARASERHVRKVGTRVPPVDASADDASSCRSRSRGAGPGRRRPIRTDAEWQAYSITPHAKQDSERPRAQPPVSGSRWWRSCRAASGSRLDSAANAQRGRRVRSPPLLRERCGVGMRAPMKQLWQAR
jgi:hypothetical protein